MRKNINIVCSIKPEWLAKICSGEKDVEYRKTKPRKNVEKIFFNYRGRIKAVADVKKVEDFYGIVENYCPNERNLVAFYLTNVRETDFPLNVLGVERSPQSWCYAR
jgi:hypothetical protein